mmetsp:Transcript_2487/g.6457  ORF Transcript_2487/g.6457 Transcript_2487/m.6457 type:complete len:321 (-) Transcript_2487:277-1239(-)
MSRVSLVVVHVSLERVLGVFTPLVFVVVVSLLPSDLIPVTRVVAPGTLPVVLPFAVAQPAELVLALRACHVHAALVLLDGSLALGARLGVCQDPVHVLRLRAVLHEPCLHSGAVHRPVPFLVAGEAEGAATVAGDVHGLGAAVSVMAVHCVLTARGGAPLEVRVGLHKAAQLVLIELGALVLVQHRHQQGHRDPGATLWDWAAQAKHRWPIGDGFRRIASPARLAEKMLARGTHHLLGGQRLKADAAGSLFAGGRWRRGFRDAQLATHCVIVHEPGLIGVVDIPLAEPEHCCGFIVRRGQHRCHLRHGVLHLLLHLILIE